MTFYILFFPIKFHHPPNIKKKKKNELRISMLEIQHTKRCTKTATRKFTRKLPFFNSENEKCRASFSLFLCHPSMINPSKPQSERSPYFVANYSLLIPDLKPRFHQLSALPWSCPPIFLFFSFQSYAFTADNYRSFVQKLGPHQNPI